MSEGVTVEQVALGFVNEMKDRGEMPITAEIKSIDVKTDEFGFRTVTVEMTEGEPVIIEARPRRQ